MAALLDERDLLRIIFCSDRPEVRAMHFAHSVVTQWPAEFSSPFKEQGEVASSMFVGREEALRNLLDPQGPTILYGGRKLGKSSIFKQLKRTFEAQATRSGHNIAIYFNAVNVVDEVGLEKRLLPQILKDLHSSLLPVIQRDGGDALSIPHFSARCDSDEFAGQIRRFMRDAPDFRLLLLVDEADSLLQLLDRPNDPRLSAAQRFGWTLRGLVQEHPGRLNSSVCGFPGDQQSRPIAKWSLLQF